MFAELFKEHNIGAKHAIKYPREAIKNIEQI
jgi:hypothetical protein